LIAEFPVFRQVELEDAKEVMAYFEKKQPGICEYNFVEMFGWRSPRNIRVSRLASGLVFLIDKKGKNYIYPPMTENPGEICVSILETLKRNGIEAGVNGITPGEFESYGPFKERFVYEDDRGNYDYLYRAVDIIALAGRKFDGKRNHIKKFRKNHSFDFVKITPDSIAQIIEFQERWCEMKRCKDDMSLANEGGAVLEMLKNFGSLPCFGGAIVVGGRVEGYSIGSRLNSETGVVIVEKANPEFGGIYQTLNQIFAGEYFKEFKFINRQQDTGNEGLRKAKMSYNPVKLIEKGNAYLKS
jgi:hypothetical protein